MRAAGLDELDVAGPVLRHDDDVLRPLGERAGALAAADGGRPGVAGVRRADGGRVLVDDGDGHVAQVCGTRRTLLADGGRERGAGLEEGREDDGQGEERGKHGREGGGWTAGSRAGGMAYGQEGRGKMINNTRSFGKQGVDAAAGLNGKQEEGSTERRRRWW